jgi:hypothetical protein
MRPLAPCALFSQPRTEHRSDQYAMAKNNNGLALLCSEPFKGSDSGVWDMLRVRALEIYLWFLKMFQNRNFLTIL